MRNLKYIILSFAFTALLSSAYGNNTIPNATITLIDNININLSLEDNADHLLFTEISYCETKKRICYKSIYTIEFVQILDHSGQIVYQLPVEIAQLHLALSSFEPGEYTVNLKLDGKNDLVSSIFKRK